MVASTSRAFSSTLSAGTTVGTPGRGVCQCLRSVSRTRSGSCSGGMGGINGLLRMVLVPADGLGDALAERHLRGVAEFLPCPADVHVTRRAHEPQARPVDRG